jgi:hypothetical protein
MKFIVYLIVGAIIVTCIEKILGIDYKDIGLFAQIAHRVTFMVFGAVLSICIGSGE